MIFAHLITAAVLLQLAVPEPVSDYKPLTEEEAARLAAWTPESKQEMWELSGQYEGDIVRPRSQQRHGLKGSRWYYREIPYQFSNDFSESEKTHITTTLTTEFAKTCVTPRLLQPGDRHYYYIRITGQNTGCWSYVGRSIRGQELNLDRRGCLDRGTIIHEFVHAAGFYHQHSAPDRDNWIDIIWENIEAGKESSFEKYSSHMVTSFGQPYDYGSVMHYDRYAYSKNGKPTIVPKYPNVYIGQRDGLSNIDIIKLNKMYNCT